MYSTSDSTFIPTAAFPVGTGICSSGYGRILSGGFVYTDGIGTVVSALV